MSGVIWIERGTHHGLRERTPFVGVSVTQAGEKSNRKGHILSVRFSEEAQKTLRLIYGDRLMIGINHSSRQLCIQRTTKPEDGFKLTTSGHRKNGTGGSLVVSARVDLPLHSVVHLGPDKVRVEGALITMDVPDLIPIARMVKTA